MVRSIIPILLLLGVGLFFGCTEISKAPLSDNQKEARQWYAKAMALSHPNPHPQSIIGKSFSDTSSALKYLGEAIRLDQNFFDAYLTRGDIFKHLRIPRMALRDFNKAITLNPNSPMAHMGQGRLLAVLNENQKALRAFNRAISIDPSSAIAYYRRGDLFFFQKQYKNSIEDYLKVIQLNPNNWFLMMLLFYSLGFAHMELKENPAACENIRKSCDMGYPFACQHIQILKICK